MESAHCHFFRLPFRLHTLLVSQEHILISMDSECGDENPFFDTKPELNLIEAGSRVLKEKSSESTKSTWFTDSRTTLQGRLWRHNITIDRKAESIGILSASRHAQRSSNNRPGEDAATGALGCRDVSAQRHVCPASYPSIHTSRLGPVLSSHGVDIPSRSGPSYVRMTIVTVGWPFASLWIVTVPSPAHSLF